MIHRLVAALSGLRVSREQQALRETYREFFVTMAAATMLIKIIVVCKIPLATLKAEIATAPAGVRNDGTGLLLQRFFICHYEER